MKKEQDNWARIAPDAIMGYAVVVSGLVAFLLLLAIVVAVVRLVVGVGSGV